MTLPEALDNFRLKWEHFTKALRENFSAYELALFFLIISMGIFFLSIAYTVLLNGGLEYTVKIGK